MSTELDYPTWPPGLSDSTALPFACWRVLHVTDGRRSIEKLAATLGGTFRPRSFTSFSPRPSRGTLEVWVPGRDEGWD